MNEKRWFLYATEKNIPLFLSFDTEEDLAGYILRRQNTLKVERIVYGIEKTFRWSITVGQGS